MKWTEIGFRKTENEIRKFEIQYNIPSDKFLTECASEDLAGGDEDYISWIGELKLRDYLLEELKALHEIEYVCRRISGQSMSEKANAVFRQGSTTLL